MPAFPRRTYSAEVVPRACDAALGRDGGEREGARLDGRIDAATYDRRRAESRGDLERVQGELERLAAAEEDFLAEGSLLLELASRAFELYCAQPASEKRRMVNLVLSNCFWKDGVLTADYREPFGLLAVATAEGEGAALAGGASGAERPGWYP